MNPERVLAVLRREFQEIAKSRGLLLAIFLPPLLITLIPLIAVAFLGQDFAGNSTRAARELSPLLNGIPGAGSWTETEVALYIIMQQFLTFFLLMPLIIPLSVAAQSIVGEKQNKSLEPLLATPVKTGELLLAKSLTALIPAILATWVAFTIFLVGGRFLIPSARVYAALLNPKWLVAMLILSPLLSLLSVSIAVIISSRVNDTRAVQQIGGFIVMPIILLGVAQTTGIILLNAVSFIVGSLAVAAIDAVILRIGVRLFQREKILTQWK